MLSFTKKILNFHFCTQGVNIHIYVINKNKFYQRWRSAKIPNNNLQIFVFSIYRLKPRAGEGSCVRNSKLEHSYYRRPCSLV